MIRLKMGNPVNWEETRAGWNYVVKLLSGFSDESGIFFDSTLDQSFGYNAAEKKENGLIPYKQPWIGFIHSTIELCSFLKDEYLLLDQIILSDEFSESFPYCKGIFTLSEYTAKYIREKTRYRVKVESLKHPTEFPAATFDFEKFLAAKKIVHAGVWLRRVSSFYLLQAPGYKKILLLNPRLLGYLGSELNYHEDLRIDFTSVEIIHRLPNDAYDQLLSASIVFLHLCDSGASNTVIECIARNTPLLVNRLEPVTEYLGKDYPFYYSSLEEAAEKLSDIELIKKTAAYLKNFSGRDELTGAHFINSFLNSEIVKSLD
jgi:hypothetical protein